MRAEMWIGAIGSYLTGTIAATAMAMEISAKCTLITVSIACKTYSLVLLIAGHAFVADSGLTLDDCRAAREAAPIFLVCEAE